MTASSKQLSTIASRSNLVALVAGFGMTLYFARSHDGPLGQSYFAAFVVAQFAALIPHEFGHAIAAWLTGSREITVRIGIPTARYTQRYALGKYALELGPVGRGRAGHTTFNPRPGPVGLAFTVLAGPVAGAAAIAVAALAIHAPAPREGLITALAVHLLVNLVPNNPSRSRSDGTQLLGLARSSTRSAMRALDIAEREVPAVPVSDDPGPPGERGIAVLDRALAEPALSAKGREVLQLERGSALWFAGRFQESAQQFEGLEKGNEGWADSYVTAALFGQLEPSEEQLATAAEAIESRARQAARSLARAHTLAVLRLVQGRPAAASLALSNYSPHQLAPAHRAAVLATQALATADPDTRAQLFQQAREAHPISPWNALEKACPGTPAAGPEGYETPTA